ncbi:hypothetical protein AALO_G00266070 [Alosa alosa]|uniref:Uncharacterized protein n=1 Tax=Alosa alosa TaxID=278164 RepID=A0AAV6FKY4_9TELE|nr:hypothetical protein AALO_G00266070 [Alosa alosa]
MASCSSRAAKLQCRWLEVSERERQAHIYNRQLLQDFHRAQDTINDLMARTAAMNTLRRLEMHLRECMTRMDDESPEVIPSDAASYSVPSTSQSYRRQEGPTQRPRNTHVVERSNKPKALVNQNSSSPTGFSQMPYTWLTQVNQPIPRTDQMITEPRGAHSSHGIPPPPFNLPHRGEVYNTYAPVHQEPPFVEDDRRENPPYTLSWAGVGEGLAPQAQPNLYGSWPPAGLPMLNPAVWRVMGMPGPSGEDVQSSQGVGQGGSGGGGEDRGPKSFQPPRSPGRGHSPGWGHGMGVNDGTSDQTCELDTRPVRLSGADDESSAASSSSRRSKHKQQEGKRPQRPVMVEKYDTASLQNGAINLDDEDGEDDEELYNQEIEDDEDDEVIVDNGYARSEGPKYNFLKYLGEKDEVEDDIEGLLAPKVEVPKQKEMIPKVIVIQKGSESDSDVEVPEKKNSSPMGPGNKEINSDDEFDHFYD